MLGLIQVFVAVGALPAGYLLLVEPDGHGLGMTTAILAGSPFKDFFIPGLFLFVVNGLSNLFGAVLCFIKSGYAAASGIILGIALLIWVLVQVYSIGLTHFLQPTFFIIGCIEIILGFMLSFQLKKKKSF
jgi:hypothetical protein